MTDKTSHHYCDQRSWPNTRKLPSTYRTRVGRFAAVRATVEGRLPATTPFDGV